VLALACIPGAVVAAPPAGRFLAGPYDPVSGGNLQFVNEIVGARIFYSSGFFGGSTIIGNVEAGFIWGNHDVFDRSGLFLPEAVERQVTAPGVTGEYDFHATMVGHVLAGTGYIAPSGASPGDYSLLGIGMAPHARLWSGAVATSYATDPEEIGGFMATAASTVPVFRQFFQGIGGQVPDVINSSYGFQDPTATDDVSLAIDALAATNPSVIFVAAAGNEAATTVASPGAVFNGITVGSVGGTNFLTPSAFSSRGATDFYNPVSSTTAVGVRAAVDIAAPGEKQILAAYLGPTGGLAPLTEVTQNPSPADLFFLNQDGTSFASPTVAGGVALMKDVAKGWGLSATAFDSRVVKSVLMAAADRTEGWNNGQAMVNGVIRTTQSLDWKTGAGALDLETAVLNYVLGETVDAAGLGGGSIGLTGWDFGSVGVNGFNDYLFTSSLTDVTELQVALNWFAGGSFNNATDTGVRSSFANLDLQVWSVVNNSFQSLIAESASLYNNSEFLRLTLPQGGRYGLRVRLPGMVYDANATPVTSASYGLSWNTVIVPEPAAGVLLIAGMAGIVVVARRRRR
jgi:hypothetical protein